MRAPTVAVQALVLLAAWAPASAAPEKARYVRKEASVVTSTGHVVRPEAHDFRGTASMEEQDRGAARQFAAVEQPASVRPPAPLEVHPPLAAEQLPALDRQSAPAAGEPLGLWPAVPEQQQDRTEEFANLTGNLSSNIVAQGHADVFANFKANLTGGATTEESGEELVNSTTNLTGRTATCSLTGDPHILTFDRSSMWHSLWGVGHWWLVQTAGNRVAIQAYYGKCGLRRGGGWMAQGRTCIMGVFIGGSFIRGRDGSDHRLIFKPPCDWDYNRMRCKTHQRFPRVIWSTSTSTATNSYLITRSFSRNGVNVRFTNRGHVVHATLPLGIKIKLHFAGPWAPSRTLQYINAYITMRQGAAGRQCGHCGNFNGNRGDDNVYNQRGLGGRGLCNAAVPCSLQLGWQEGMGCAERNAFFLAERERDYQAQVDGLKKCKGKKRAKAIKDCIDAFDKKGANIKNWENHQECKACVIDQCLGGGFLKADAQAANDMPKF